MSGFVQIPRSISALRPTLRTLLEYICHEVRFSTPLETDFGIVGIGEMITSRSALMRATGLTAQKVRTALEQLVSGGFIEVETTARYSKIALVWPDYIMLNNQVNNQVPTSASDDISTDYSGKKNEITKSITKSITNISNKDIDKDYYNTHTKNNNYPGINQNAPARESAPAYTQADAEAMNDQRVIKLYEWMSLYTAELLMMARSFSPSEVLQMVEGYPTAEIHSILSQMWSKRVYEREAWAYIVFKKYAGVTSENSNVEDKQKLYSYDEMCEFVHRHGGSSDQHFEPVPQPTGKPKWRRIN